LSSEPVINVQELLSPIPGENPAGENLRYSGVHDQIREARRAEEALEQGDWKRDTKTADWPEVKNLSAGALSTKTKDLQVCAWLGEALIKLHGFSGLRDSLRLMRGLLENFWDRMYPEVDEGDLEARANGIAFLDKQAAFAIKEVPITNNNSGRNYSFLEWQEAKKFDIPENLDKLDASALAKVEELKKQAEEEGRVTTEKFRLAKNVSRRAFYEGIFAELNECWEDYKALDKVMDEKFGRETPGLSALRKSLEEIRSLVESTVKEKRLQEPDPSEAGTEQPAAAPGEAGAGAAAFTGSGSGPIRTRQEALRRLAEVSEYFRATEPHSPVSYLVQRAIRWGQMPLDSWLQDVIKDGNVLNQLREILGLASVPEASGQ